MQILLALFAVLVRLSRPSRGLHADSYGYAHQLISEVRRRSRRVRPYVRRIQPPLDLIGATGKAYCG